MIELWPSLAEFFVYDEIIYRLLASDTSRNDAYRRACAKVLAGKTVVEIGPGTELVLSQICLEAGARRVYAIEILESTYLRAQERVRALGLEDRIILIHGDATQVRLPEPADYCVSEIVGPIGGAEGAARIINDSRHLLRHPTHVLPSRTVTRLAAVRLPSEVLDAGFSEIAWHYVEKTFTQRGLPFDIRVCVKGVSRDHLVSTAAVFEDIDYTQPIELEHRHPIRVEFTRDDEMNGFLVWLELFVDADERLDVIENQASWLPTYFPLSTEALAVRRGDWFEGTVTRSLSHNGLNPDYVLTGHLHREGQPVVPITYEAPHFESRFRSNAFYRRLFDGRPGHANRSVAGPPPNRDAGSRVWPDTSIVELFDAQTEATPGATALVDGGGATPRSSWTYRQLQEAVDQVARNLTTAGVAPGAPVVVLLDRSPASVIALLAVFRVGGVYVPVDPVYPDAHFHFVVKDTRAAAVLSDTTLAHRVPTNAPAVVYVDAEDVSPAVEVGSSCGAAPNDLDRPATILYTPGDSGRPRGVVLSHRLVLNRFHWLWESYPFGPAECVGERTPSIFIPSLWGMLGGLLKGARTVILPSDVVKDPALLVQVLREERVTRIAMVPTLLGTLLDAVPNLGERLPDLTLWFTAAEVLTAKMFERFRQAHPRAVLSNDYGTTEVSGVLAFDSRWTDDHGDPLPVGRLVANCSAYILTEDGRPVAPGETGRLHIGGLPATATYLNQPEAAAAKFLPDPFSDQPGARMCFVGDLAWQRPDGMFVLAGRCDRQVKVRGIRVELDGVERILAAHPAVREVAVQLQMTATGDQLLVALVVRHAWAAADAGPLREFVRRRLPGAMVPTHVSFVTSLPRTLDGRIDRDQLPIVGPAPRMAPAVAPVVATPADDSPRQWLRTLVAEVLGAPPLDASTDTVSFPSLGLHSVSMVHLARRVSDVMGHEISVTRLFDHFSIARLADHLAATFGPAPAPAREADPPARSLDDEAIAIVGYAGRFPKAPDCDTFWANIARGVDAVGEVPRERWDTHRYFDQDPTAPNRTNSKWAGVLEDVDQFDPLFFQCSPKEARWMDPQQRLFLETCWRALEHAGCPDRMVNDQPVGVFAGVRPSDYLTPREGLEVVPDALTLLGNDSAILASRVSHFLNLKGPNLSVDTSCSSSLTAIHLACRSLRDGECTMALAGGVSVITSPEFFIQATKAGMLSPTGRCRTFDHEADGFAPGEGVGVVVLKTLARARRDGDRIHGVIRASGLNQDGQTGGLTVPNTVAQAALETSVYDKAGISPASIGYVEAHGTGTRLGDPIEVAALTRAFHAGTTKRHFCRIGSAKENIGHLAAAAGVAGLIRVLLALAHRTIPPNVHVQQANPQIDFDDSPFVLSRDAQPWLTEAGTPRRAAISAFGFSGTNVHMLVEDAPAVETPAPAGKAAYLFTLSARTQTALTQKRTDLAQWLTTVDGHVRIEDVSYTLNAGRSHFAHRACWVASSLVDLRRQLRDASTGQVTSAGALADVAARYVSGADIDWSDLHAGESRVIVNVPGYPFERQRYWHTEPTPPASGARPSTPLSYLQPTWMPDGSGADPVVGERTYALAGDAWDDRWRMVLAAAYQQRRVAVAAADDLYVFDRSPEAVVKLFTLVRSLDAARPLGGPVVALGLRHDENPSAGALAGFCRALASERPAWRVRCVDAATAQDMFRAPAGISSVEDGRCSRQRLASITPSATTTPAFREGGVYLIAGGGGGIGRALSQYLARTYRARCVLLGRRQLAQEDARAIAAEGGWYVQVDIGDTEAVDAVVREVVQKTGALHGVVHAALALHDAPLSAMDESTFRAGLHAKVAGTLALHRAVQAMPLDFFVCFSSVQSFAGLAGQANYAAASAFQDAWARATARTSAYPIRVINWGYWGEVGAVATPAHRKLMASQGVGSIDVAEGVEAIERVLAGPHNHVVVVRGEPAFLASIGLEAPAASIAEWVADRVHRAFEDVGVLGVVGRQESIDQLARRLAVAPQHQHLFRALLTILADAGVLSVTGDRLEVLHRTRAVSPPVDDVRVPVVEACLTTFGPLLRGEVAAPEVLFPGGAMHLVEGLYRDLPETRAIRDEVVSLAAAASSPFRILEIGAGTGGTSVGVLAGLSGFDDRVHYDYTDVSSAFTRHGTRQFGATYPFARFAVLDIERDPAAQGFEPGSYDVVIAANVLHATRDLASTLTHSRALLKPGGRLLLHEQTTLESFLTVTFGWLEGWWRFVGDAEATRAGDQGPLLTPAQWTSALQLAGFDGVSMLAANDAATRHVMAASAVSAASSRRSGSALTAAFRDVLELDPATIEPDRPLRDYGVDSILAQALVNTINRDLGVHLKAADLYTHPTFRALSAHVERVAPSPATPTDAPSAAPSAQATVDADGGRIAIIGMSGRFPGADNLQAFWDNLSAGRGSVTVVPPERWDADAVYDADPMRPGTTNSRWGGFLSDIDRFDAAFFRILPVEAEWMDPQQRLFLQEAWRALEDAGLPDRELDGRPCSVFVGCKEGDYARLFAAAPENSHHAAGTNSAILAARLSYHLNLRGPSLAIDTACSSSLVALHLACDRLRTHPDEIAVAGGVSVMATAHTHLLLGKSGMLSPVGQCRTFDRDADGFVPGEAVAAVVLKPLAAAVRDGDHIYGVIVGSEMNQDGRTNGITAPSATAQAALERAVLAGTGISAESVGYIETHGTGTRLGDPIELAALAEVYGGATSAVGSVKSNIGHTLAAAGIASVAKVLLCLSHRQLVPTLNLAHVTDEVDADARVFDFNTTLKDWPARDGLPRRAAVSGFGFSGTNVHMIIEEPPPRAAARAARTAYLVPLSARTPAALMRRIDDLHQHVTRTECDLADVAWTLVHGRSHFVVREAVVVRSISELIQELARLRATGREAAAPPGRDGVRDELLALADLYRQGHDLDWDRLLPAGAGCTIPLPTYPFERDRYWVPEHTATRRVTTMFAERWRPSLPTPRAARNRAPVVILCGADLQPFARTLFDDHEVVVISDRAALRAFEGTAPIAGCVDLTAWSDETGWDDAIWTFLQHRIENQRQIGLGLVQVCRLLSGWQTSRTRLAGATLAGLYRMLGAEYPAVDARVLDTDCAPEDWARLKTHILTEWRSVAPQRGVCCYRADVRYEPEWTEVAEAPSSSQSMWPSDRVVVVSGATGGLGSVLTRHLVTRGVKRIAILARTADRASAQMRVLEAEGVAVAVYAGRLTDRDALMAFRDRIHRDLGPVGGVLHCAGMAATEHPAFIRKPLTDVRAVCEPKVEGLRVLDHVFGADPLEFFVTCSSVAAAVPSLASGQSDYAMANAYMDYFIQHRSLEVPGRYRSIQWPNWDGVGMGGATSAAYDATGLLSLTVADGCRLFDQVLALDDVPVVLPCVHRGTVQWQAPPSSQERAPLVRERADGVDTPSAWLAGILQRELKLQGPIDPDVTFPDLGLDSIMSAEVIKVIGRELGVTLEPTLFFEFTTLRALTRRLAPQLVDAAPRVEPTPVTTPAPQPVPAASEAVAVIGMSCRFPGAPDIDSFWRQLQHGERALGPASPTRSPGIRAGRVGGFLADIEQFDPAFFRLRADEATQLEPEARLMLEEAVKTFHDAGYDRRSLDGVRAGVYVGAVGHHSIAASISRVFNLTGPSAVIDTACSSALVGLQMAVRAIQYGDIDLGLVGGVHLLTDDDAYGVFEARGLLRPDASFHVFDERADGVVLGEGAGAVLLKSLSAAQRDGDRVLAVISGIAVNNNGRTAGPVAPNLQAQQDVVAAALRASGRRADEVGAVETSGAGSVVNDLLELKCLEAVLGGAGRQRSRCYLGCVKPTIGHLLPAAGLASLLKATLSVSRGAHPPFLSGTDTLVHFDYDRAGFAFARVSHAWHADNGVRVACVTSFPDGGTNCSVIVESYPHPQPDARSPLPAPRFSASSAPAEVADTFWVLTE